MAILSASRLSEDVTKLVIVLTMLMKLVALAMLFNSPATMEDVCLWSIGVRAAPITI